MKLVSVKAERAERELAKSRKLFYDALYGAVAKPDHRPQSDRPETQAS